MSNDANRKYNQRGVHLNNLHRFPFMITKDISKDIKVKVNFEIYIADRKATTCI